MAPGDLCAAESTGALAVSRNQAALVCPDSDALAVRVAALMERPVASVWVAPARADVGLDVQLACDASSCQAQIRTSGASQGLRELRDPDPSCAGLADALAVTLAVLLDGKGPTAAAASASAGRPAPSAPASAPPASSPAASGPVASASASPGSAARSGSPGSAPEAGSRAWGLTPGVTLGGGVAAGVLRSAGPLVTAEGEVRLPVPLRVGLGAFWMPAQSFGYQGGTVTMGTWGGTLVACVPFAVGPVEVGGCGALTLAVFRARGAGYVDPTTAHRDWLLPGAGVDVRGAIGRRLGWSVRALGQVRDREQTLSVGSLGTASTLPRVSLVSRLALTVSF